MTTATITPAEAPAGSLAAILNAHLKYQDANNPLDYTHDRCDRCGAAAKSRFSFSDSALQFCGHHTVAHIGSLVARSRPGFWIEPSILGAVKGVVVPDQDFTKSGDGLTDA